MNVENEFKKCRFCKNLTKEISNYSSWEIPLCIKNEIFIDNIDKNNCNEDQFELLEIIKNLIKEK